MKVLSLTEPYATLIKEHKKFIETRSWKTEYRGEIYIHASATKVPMVDLDNDQLMSLVASSLSFGSIICKCRLVDCILMTHDYVEDMKHHHPQEYLCGDYREGRYAWILEDIIVLENPIRAKGQLGIWNYYSEDEVMNLMNEIEYGWMDHENHKHFCVDETYAQNYYLQSPREVLKNKIGVCWDQVELERYYFKGHDWKMKTFFLCYYDEKECPSHTFLVYEKKDQFYWFEHSWGKYQGIHSYGSLKELFCDVREKFILTELDRCYCEENLLLREYQKPSFSLTATEFYQHCEKSDPIDLTLF